MFENISLSERKIAIQRLTALWALNECGLGGLLHAFQSPFTGLLVGGFAMICIAFICALSKNVWKSILPSLMIVLIIKGLVSPHSPPTAYIAVVFQAFTGGLIFRFLPGLFGSILFFTLGLIESAIQRLLTLTILYGKTLWEAIDNWGQWVTKTWNVILPFTSSSFIIGFYLCIHVVAGILLGIWVHKLVRFTSMYWGDEDFKIILSESDKISFPVKPASKKFSWRKILFLCMIPFIIIFSYFVAGQHEGIQTGLISVIRAVCILLLWYTFLGPLLIRLLHKWLAKKHEQLANEVSLTMDLFPQLIWILRKAWKESAGLLFVKRWKIFSLKAFLYTLQFQTIHDSDPLGSHPEL